MNSPASAWQPLRVLGSEQERDTEVKASNRIFAIDSALGRGPLWFRA